MPVCFCCAYPLPELILQDAAENVPAACFEAEEQEGQQPEHEVGLFAAYHKRQRKNTGTTPAHQLSHYMDISEGQNALLFWAINQNTLPALFQVAIRALAVPASSAPVERVFSHGGIILRPSCTNV